MGVSGREEEERERGVFSVHVRLGAGNPGYSYRVCMHLIRLSALLPFCLSLCSPTFSGDE